VARLSSSVPTGRDRGAFIGTGTFVEQRERPRGKRMLGAAFHPQRLIDKPGLARRIDELAPLEIGFAGRPISTSSWSR